MANPLFQMAIAQGLLPNIVQPDGAVLTEANLLRLHSDAGDVLLATVPGELLPKLGLALKAQPVPRLARHRLKRRPSSA